MAQHAAIALFVYKRLWHTKQTVESLLKNDGCGESDIIVFCDGAKRSEDEPQVHAVREYAKGIHGFRSVTIIEREKNLGLAQSIISGVSDILSREDKVIVLEDDLYLSPYFLKYMNDGLNLYENDARVASIHGYVYPVDYELPETFFIRGADCWGWATWRRAWEKFNPDGTALLKLLKDYGLMDAFDYGGYAGNKRMLVKQIAGKNDSWAIRWHASAFLADMYTLYPGRSLVRNIGMDGQGTHSEATDKFETEVASLPVKVEPLPVGESPGITAAFGRFYRRVHSSPIKRLFSKLF